MDKAIQNLAFDKTACRFFCWTLFHRSLLRRMWRHLFLRQFTHRQAAEQDYLDVEFHVQISLRGCKYFCYYQIL